MEFVALDVETANADMASICQIGLARYENGLLVEEWKTYVDPEDYFDGINISIHGIDEATVKGSPTLPCIASCLCGHLGSRIGVCHTHFDRVSLRQAFAKYELPDPGFTWLDSARVARRTWEEFARGGYGLKNVCDFIGYEFAHHDALEDAKAAAHVLLAAMEKTGLDIPGWLKRVEQPIFESSACRSQRPGISRDGNPEGALYGEVLVFTGALSIPRGQAADMAANIGCAVADGVTKNTTILVVGDQDVRKLAGQEKSSKHRKAEDLIKKGQAIRIIRETDFSELVASEHLTRSYPPGSVGFA
jgi:DNA polymerase-3 subunit epsilon